MLHFECSNCLIDSLYYFLIDKQIEILSLYFFWITKFHKVNTKFQRDF